MGAKHFHTSAKLNKGIEEMFLDLSKGMIEKAGQDNNRNQKDSTNRKSVVVVDDDPSAQQKTGCC